MPAGSGLGLLRRAPLAAHVLAMFALADAGAACAATTWAVTSCSNFPTGFGTSGTLRYALNHALDGDTVDMTSLVCSTIDLTEAGTTAAPLPIPYGTITVLGPGRDKLTITGNHTVRIFSGLAVLYPSQLVLKDLSLAYGRAEYDPTTLGNGGCILTTRSLTLDRVRVDYCVAAGRGGGVRAADVTLDQAFMDGSRAGMDGGAISATSVDMTDSFVFANQSLGNGGGIRGTFVAVTNSTITVNTAGTISAFANGGGIYVSRDLTVAGSTISANYVFGNEGGIDAYNKSPSGITTTIVNSTISGNHASFAEGGIYVNSGHTKFYNSTIAFNYATHDSTVFASGVATSSVYGDIDLTFYSTLISNNFGGATEHDFSLSPGIGHTVTQHGSHNFARTTDYSPNVFSFQGQCPLLGPLRSNGGPTLTHALMSKSPAIDAGDNVYTPMLLYDQRGPPYQRVANGTADIGAYEVPAGVVFNSGFEGC